MARKKTDGQIAAEKRAADADKLQEAALLSIPQEVLDIFLPKPLLADPKPRGRGRPKHVPLPWQKALVRYLAGLGVPQRLIAKEAGVGVDTLHAYYRAELDEGMDRSNMLVTGSLFKKAISDTHPQAVTAAIWWDKTRGGKSETVNVNQTGGDAQPEEIPEDASQKDAAAAYAATLMSD